MAKVFLVSDLNINATKEIDNTNGIIEQIINSLNDNKKMVFLVSSPNDFKTNDFYANITFEGFKNSGIEFDKNIIIDYRFVGNIHEEIESANLIFLAGGNTFAQMKYFEEIGLKSILTDFNGVIIGQSAGALNLAMQVVCSPEDESQIGKNSIWSGLEMSSINIEPHFQLLIYNELDIQLRKELLKLSINYPLYALPDGTHIFDDGIEQFVYGEAYYIFNKTITQICSHGKKLQI